MASAARWGFREAADAIALATVPLRSISAHHGTGDSVAREGTLDACAGVDRQRLMRLEYLDRSGSAAAVLGCARREAPRSVERLESLFNSGGGANALPTLSGEACLLPKPVARSFDRLPLSRRSGRQIAACSLACRHAPVAMRTWINMQPASVRVAASSQAQMLLLEFARRAGRPRSAPPLARASERAGEPSKEKPARNGRVRSLAIGWKFGS